MPRNPRQGLKCHGHKQDGSPCGAYAITGGKVCGAHGGRPKQTRSKAVVRAELMSWGLNDATEDPGEVLLRLVTQSARRAARYAEELEELVAESPNLRTALIAEAHGEFGPVGEYVRGLATLEATERDRCATFATKAIAAGLAERQVRLAERQGALIADVLRAVLDDPAWGLSDAQKRKAPDIIRAHIRAIAA